MVEGLPVDAGTSLVLDPFRMNLLPYLPSACMPTDDVFAGYEESLLIVKNDDSDYFVPAYGVMTLSELCPGEAYGVFLSGTSGIDFMYPMGGGLSSNHNGQIVENYKSRAHVDVLPETGESHLIIVTDVIGDLNMGVGDQIRAYANNNLVSAINIVQEHVDGIHPIDLVAPSSLSEYAPYIIPSEGYVKDSDVIELTYVRNGVEYEGTLNVIEGSSQYDGLFTSGTLDISIVQATEFGISGNYPNPFNPTTTIEYNVEISGHVTLKIYDIMGRVVRTLVDEYK